VLLALAALGCVDEDSAELPTHQAPLAPEVPPPEPGPEPPGDLPACQPRASAGPYWLTEQDTIAITLECASGATLPGEELEVLNLPPHARYDAAARRITFSPGLDQAGVYDLELGVVGRDERGHIEVQVADRFDAVGNVPPDPATYTEEYGVPVVHLEVDPGVNADEYTPAVITYRGKTYEGTQAKYRGQTSLAYPKKSYTLEFAKRDRFSDPLSVAGFTGKRKVTLTTTFDDNSYLRARLAFELWNRIGVEHVQVQAYSVVVFLGGLYLGLYTLTDKVDGNLMQDNGLFEDGNLYKARTHDANFRLTRAAEPSLKKTDLAMGFTKEEGTPALGEPGANADLEELVSWVATSSREAFLSELDERIVRRDYEDWWMLVTLLNAGDSAGKNTYHYRDARPGAPDGRFRMLPWDFNDSFGQSWSTLRKLATRDAEELNPRNEIFARLCAEPETRAPLIERLRSAFSNEWKLESVLEAVDTWAEEVHGAALRDELVWSERYAAYYSQRTDILSHEQEVAYMRQWIIDRYSHLAAHFGLTDEVH
jgi:spore coat protein H